MALAFIVTEHVGRLERLLQLARDVLGVGKRLGLGAADLLDQHGEVVIPMAGDRVFFAHPAT